MTLPMTRERAFSTLIKLRVTSHLATTFSIHSLLKYQDTEFRSVSEVPRYRLPSRVSSAVSVIN